MNNLLVTGGAGFIGSNFIRYWINKYPSDNIINLDKLTYAGNLSNLANISNKENYHFVRGDIGNKQLVEYIFSEFNPNLVVNFAAESHNSLSFIKPEQFMITNALNVMKLLDVIRNFEIERFHHISTCEVYGDLELDSLEEFKETSPYNPKTPYNASKAAGDHIVRAYYKSFGVPITITNCANNYGPYQFPEKVIPLFTTNILENKKIPIYESSENKREWVHVKDHIRAIEIVLQRGNLGETYNVGTGIEKSVDDLVEIIFDELNAPSNLKQIVPDRPQHDKRYLLNSNKIKNDLGWVPKIDFENGIRKTIQWYVENTKWWKPLKNKISIDEKRWKELDN